jgi:hypothetical protein
LSRLKHRFHSLRHLDWIEQNRFNWLQTHGTSTSGTLSASLQSAKVINDALATASSVTVNENIVVLQYTLRVPGRVAVQSRDSRDRYKD